MPILIDDNGVVVANEKTFAFEAVIIRLLLPLLLLFTEAIMELMR